MLYQEALQEAKSAGGGYGTIGSGGCKFLNRSSVGKPKSFGDYVLGWATTIPILGWGVANSYNFWVVP